MADQRATKPGSGQDTMIVIRQLCGFGVVIASVWLVVSPFGFALDFVDDETALWSTIAIGVIALVAMAAGLARTISMAMAFAIAGVSGIWAIVAPYVVEFVGGTGGDAAVSSIVTGVILFALAGIGLATLDQQNTEKIPPG